MESNQRESVIELISNFRLAASGGTIPYGIGCAWLGRKDLLPETLKKETELLEAAYGYGFRYFDTSSAYGNSEVVVGEWISLIDRQTIFLATKSVVPERISAELAARFVKVNLQASLERLQTAYIDLFQIHDVRSLSQVLADGGVLAELREAKRQGLIRAIGLATRDLRLLGEAVRHGGFDTVLTYGDYTPLHQGALPLIRSAKEHGVGVINGSPLSFGLLTGVEVQHPEDTDDADLAKRKQIAGQYHRLCRQYGVPVARAALYYPLLEPGIAMTLTGPATMEQLQQSFEYIQAQADCGLKELFDAWSQMSRERGWSADG